MRLNDWLTYRDGWRNWLRIAGIVLVPIAFVALGVIWYRVHEIPAVVNGVVLAGDPFDVADYDRPATEEENTTALFYVEALNSYQVREWRPDLVEEMREWRHDQFEEVSQSPREIVGFSGTPAQSPAAVGIETPPVMIPIPDDVLPASLPDYDETKSAQERDAQHAALRREALEKNAQSLEWMLSATQREHCVLRRPSSASLGDMPGVAKDAGKLAVLLIIAGQLAEHEGKLDEALDYYLRTRRFAQHIARFGNYAQCLAAVQVDNLATSAIINWADRPGQTTELLQRALEEVRARPMVDLLADAPKTQYLLALRAIESGSGGAPVRSSGVDALSLAAAEVSRFPWERARQLRLLRLATCWATHFPHGATANVGIISPWPWLRREPLSKRSNEALRQLIGESSLAPLVSSSLDWLEVWAGGTYVNAEHHLHNALERIKQDTGAASTPFGEPSNEGIGE